MLLIRIGLHNGDVDIVGNPSSLSHDAIDVSLLYNI